MPKSGTNPPTPLPHTLTPCLLVLRWAQNCTKTHTPRIVLMWVLSLSSLANLGSSPCTFHWLLCKSQTCSIANVAYWNKSLAICTGHPTTNPVQLLGKSHVVPQTFGPLVVQIPSWSYCQSMLVVQLPC